MNACNYDKPPSSRDLPTPDIEAAFGSSSSAIRGTRTENCDVKCAELSLEDKLVCLVRECRSGTAPDSQEVDDIEDDVATCLEKECVDVQGLERTLCLFVRCGEASELRKRRWGDVVSMCIASHCGDVTGSLRMDCIVKKCHKHRRST